MDAAEATASQRERTRGLRILLVTAVVLVLAIGGIVVVYVRGSSAGQDIRPTGILPANDVHALWVAPLNPAVFLAGHHEGISRTSDGGKTWVSVTATLDDVLAFASVPSNQSVFAAGPGYLARSDDLGLTWQRASLSPANLDIRALAIDPESQALVANVSNQGLMVSRDGGRTWTAMPSDAPANATSFAIAASSSPMPGMNAPAGPMLYAASPNQGVVVSMDGGKRWQGANGSVNLTLPRTPVAGIASDGNMLYVATNQGVFGSNDGGRGWFATNRDFKLPVGAIGASPASKGLVVAVTTPRQVFVSRDRGATWGG